MSVYSFKSFSLTEKGDCQKRVPEWKATEEWLSDVPGESQDEDKAFTWVNLSHILLQNMLAICYQKKKKHLWLRDLPQNIKEVSDRWKNKA